MAVGDVYRLTSTFSYLGKTTQNVFHYVHQSANDANNAFSLGEAWQEDVLPQILDGMSEDCVCTDVEVINLMDISESASFPGLTDAGTIIASVATNAAAFIAWSWRFPRPSPAYSDGYKRFTGVVEDLTAGVIYILPPGVESALEAALQITITWSAGFAAFRQVVVKGVYSYAIPPTDWFLVTSATYTNLTTQSSRK